MDKAHLEKIVLTAILVCLLVLLFSVLGTAFRPEEVNDCKGVYDIYFIGSDVSCGYKCHKTFANICGYTTASGISNDMCYCYIPATAQDSPELDWILGWEQS